MEAVKKALADGLIPLDTGEVVLQRLQDLSQMLTKGWQEVGVSAATGAFLALGQAAAGQKGAFKRFLQGTFNLVADYMQQIGQAMLLTGFPPTGNPIGIYRGAANNSGRGVDRRVGSRSGDGL